MNDDQRDQDAARLLALAKRYARTRFCNVDPRDRDDVVQDVVIRAMHHRDIRRHSVEELESFLPVRLQSAGKDARRARARRSALSLDQPVGDEPGSDLTLVDTVASRRGDPHERFVALDDLAGLAEDFRALGSYLAEASLRVRVIERMARAGAPRERIVAELRDRHGIEMSHQAVRQVVSRDLIRRFPPLRFLWENRAASPPRDHPQ